MKRFWIINLALFQACWLTAAFFPDNRELIMAGLIIGHFILSPTILADSMILLLVPIGAAVDKLLFEVGVLATTELIFPFWLLLLWMIFIVSLNHSLKWLDSISLVWIMPIGAIGGGMSYWAGVNAGALTSNLSTLSLLACLMIVWACLLPVLVWLRRQLIPHQSLQAAG